MIGRRGFLRLSGLGLLATVPGAGLLGCGGPGAIVATDPSAQRAAERAVELFDPEAAALIGSHYLSDAVPDSDPEAMAELLEPVIELLDRDESTAALGARVMERLERDLLDGRAHDLAGWTLSATELEACLLVYLVMP